MVVLQNNVLYESLDWGQDVLYYKKLASIAYGYERGDKIPFPSVVPVDGEKYIVMNYHRTAAQLLLSKEASVDVLRTKVDFGHYNLFGPKIDNACTIEDIKDAEKTEGHILFSSVPEEFLMTLDRIIEQISISGHLNFSLLSK